jgi:predicted porin
MGGGLQAVGQLDLRFEPDNGAIQASGNDWIGLKSPGMGMITLGRWDLHYGKSPSDMASKGALKSAPIGLMDYMPAPSGAGRTPVERADAAGGNASVANTTRTPNVIKWDSPNWSGFELDLAYSTNQGGQEADLTSGVRKGSSTMVNPSFTGANFKVEWSHWQSKKDAPTDPNTTLAATAAKTTPTWDEKGDTLNAYYKMGAFKFGVAWNKSSLEDALQNDATGEKAKTERTAWTIPVSYTTGAHEVHFHYTVANKVKYNGTEVDNTGAKMIAAAYAYNLSKRTSMSVTYAKITNDENVAYNFFTDTGAGQSSAGLPVKAGEDPQLLAVILKHSF